MSKDVQVRADSPVRSIAPEVGHEKPQDGIGLCLSGGGYRAMLFHLGTLWRLNEFGYLKKLDRISSVSGGSITAGVLGMNWNKLAFDADGVATGFASQVVDPIRRIAGKTIDRGAVFSGSITPGVTISDRISKAYRKYLFGNHTLQDLPDDPPRFVINATNMQSGALWRFMKPCMRDWRVGKVPKPNVPLADAVAASSAFPPILSPAKLELEHEDYAPGSGEDLQREPFTTHVILSDGGVYDNLGLETVWKRYNTVFVSDAGGRMSPKAKPGREWLTQVLRVMEVIDNQVRCLRKRQTITCFESGERNGAYWGIRTNIEHYDVGDALPCPIDRTTDLAKIKTRLKRLSPARQERLINWGYAVCDAGMRRHVDRSLPGPRGFPYPEAGV